MIRHAIAARNADLSLGWRRRLADAVLVLFAVAVLVVVVQTLRRPLHPSSQVAVAGSTASPASPAPATAPRTVSPIPTSALVAPTTRAVLAAAGGVVLRWTGTECPSAQATQTTTIERSVDDGATWTAVRSPFAVVLDLTLAGSKGFALGVDAACRPTTAVTTDAGMTWKSAGLPDGSTAIDAVPGGGRWSIVSGEVRRGASTSPSATSGEACKNNGAGPASLVSATTMDKAWLLCQDSAGAGRLLLGTSDAGRTWQRLAGVRLETGLAGGHAVAAMDFLPGGLGWVLIRDADCPEGELRLTTNAGTKWTTLPCVSRTVPTATKILAVTYVDSKTALAVAVVADQPRLLRSDDSGRVWRLATAER